MPVTPGKLYSFGGFFKSRGISQPSEHWLEWYSTKTGEDTNNRPARPYPLYFTPHFVIGTGATEWTYANRTFVLPAGFPNVELTHRYSIVAPGSGSICLDDIFFRELPSPNATNWSGKAKSYSPGLGCTRSHLSTFSGVIVLNCPFTVAAPRVSRSVNCASLSAAPTRNRPP